MTKIQLCTVDQKLNAKAKPIIASGDVKSVSLEIEFDAPWTGFTPYAVFFNEKKPDDVYGILMSESECVVPAEVLADDGMMYIGVRGVNGDRVKTSSLVKVKLEKGAPSSTEEAIEPTPSMYQQLLARFNNILQSETSDGELLDVRIGYYDELYDTAGDAVRGQIGMVLQYVKDNFAKSEAVITMSDSIGNLKSIVMDIDTEVEHIKNPLSGVEISGRIYGIPTFDDYYKQYIFSYSLGTAGNIAIGSYITDDNNDLWLVTGNTGSGFLVEIPAQYVVYYSNEKATVYNLSNHYAISKSSFDDYTKISIGSRIKDANGCIFTVVNSGTGIFLLDPVVKMVGEPKNTGGGGDTYSKEEIDAIMGSYVTDVAEMIGGIEE